MNDTLPEGCNGCGKCCQNILMMHDDEIIRIKKYIKQNNIKPVNRNTIFTNSDICPFLNENNRCNIYPVRADICKNFFCKNFMETDMNYDYRGIKAIEVLGTFFPKEFNPNPPDLSQYNERIKRNLELLKKRG